MGNFNGKQLMGFLMGVYAVVHVNFKSVDCEECSDLADRPGPRIAKNLFKAPKLFVDG